MRRCIHSLTYWMVGCAVACAARERAADPTPVIEVPSERAAAVPATEPGDAGMPPRNRPPGGLPTCNAEQSAADRAEARNAFRVGAKAYQEGAYQSAVTEFLRSYELSCRPQLLYNIATALERLDDKAGAADVLRHYLELDPSAPNAEQVRTRIDTLERER